VTIAEGMRAMGITPQACKSLVDAKGLVDRFFERRGETVADQIKLALIIFGLPLRYEPLVLATWRAQGK
jgi:hypothetical protein